MWCCCWDEADSTLHPIPTTAVPGGTHCSDAKLIFGLCFTVMERLSTFGIHSKLNLFYTKVTFLHYVNCHTYFHRMHDDSNDIIYQLDKAPPPSSSMTTPMHGWQVLPIPSPDAIQFFLWGMLRTVFALHIQQNLSELGKQIIAVISNIHEML